MVGNMTLLPTAVMAACDAEAKIWAVESDLDSWIAKMSSDPKTRAKLREICMQCFSEGVYRGGLCVIDGKSLQASILQARKMQAPVSNDGSSSE